jgi:hypothetical protein
MPRLVGKKINLAFYTSLGFLAVGIAAIALDYFGVVNFIPNFGPETNTDSTSKVKISPTNK